MLNVQRNMTLWPALLVCATCLLLSGCGSAKHKWTWEPEPYEVSVQDKAFYKYDASDIIEFQDVEGMEDLTCFRSDNMAELAINIKKMNLPKKIEAAIMKEFDKVAGRVVNKRLNFN